MRMFVYLLDTSYCYEGEGRTGCGEVWIFCLQVSDVSYMSRIVWFRGVDVTDVLFGYKVFVKVVTMYEKLFIWE